MHNNLPINCDENFSKLEDAFIEAARLFKNLIVIFNEISLGICIHMSKFYVFDSHFPSQEGMRCADGSCVLRVFDNLSEICCFLRRLSAHIQAHTSGVQFDLHLLTLKKM